MHLFQKLGERGIFLFIFLIPLQTRWIVKQGMLDGGYWEYGTYSVYALDVLCIILFVVDMMQRRIQRNMYAGKPSAHFLKQERSIGIVLIGLLIVAVFSSVWAYDTGIALYGFFRLLEGVLLFVWIASSKFSISKCAAAYVASGVIQSIYGLYQFLFQKTYASSWLGLSFLDPSVSGTSVVETVGGRFLRAYGFFPHPNILAGFLVIALLFATGLYAHADSLRTKYLTLSCGILIVAGLFSTFSRSAILIVLFALLGFFLMRRACRSLRSAASVFLCGIAAVGALFIFFYPDLFHARGFAATRLEAQSFTDRYTQYTQTSMLLQEHAFAGVGMQQFTLWLYLNSATALPASAYQPAHVFYALIFSELGGFGILLFLVFVSMIIHAWVTKKILVGEFFQRASDYSCVAFLSFCALLALGFVDHYAWTLFPGILLFWSVVGVCYLSITVSESDPMQ